MNKVAINIKIDPEVKKEAQEVAEKLGFSLSSVINAYLKDFLRTRRINIGLQEELELSGWAKKELTKSQQDYREGRFSSFNSEKEALAYLGNFIADAEEQKKRKS